MSHTGGPLNLTLVLLPIRAGFFGSPRALSKSVVQLHGYTATDLVSAADDYH
jgi:hypothetical protein